MHLGDGPGLDRLVSRATNLAETAVPGGRCAYVRKLPPLVASDQVPDQVRAGVPALPQALLDVAASRSAYVSVAAQTTMMVIAVWQYHPLWIDAGSHVIVGNRGHGIAVSDLVIVVLWAVGVWATIAAAKRPLGERSKESATRAP